MDTVSVDSKEYAALKEIAKTARELRRWGVRTIQREHHGKHPAKFFMTDADVVRFHEISDTLADQLQQLDAVAPSTAA